MKRSDYSEALTIFGLDVARGIFPHVLAVNKFGANPIMDAADPETDIWEFGKQQPEYIFPLWGTAPIDSLSSSDIVDTQDVQIQGLDIEGLLVEQTVILNGRNRVALSIPLWRVFRMFNADKNMATGQGISIAGTVYCYEDTAITDGVPDDDTKVRAVIIDGNNQTQMGIYTIPKGFTGYFLGGGAGIAKSGGVAVSATLQFKMREFGGVFRIQKTVSVGSQSDSYYLEDRVVKDRIPELTDIRLLCSDLTANGVSLWAGIEILLVDETKEKS